MPTSYQALFIALLVIAPGWIAVQTWSRGNKTWARPTGQLAEFLHALSVSAVIQLIASPFSIWWLYAYRDHLDAHPRRLAAWLALILFGIPVVGGAAFSKLGDILYQRRLRHSESWIEKAYRWLWPAVYPSAWDSFFADNIPDGRFLTITFKDGSRVCGTYGGMTFAKTSPQERGLYLETEWLLDESGYPSEKVPGSAGILIHDFSNIQKIRVQEAGDGE